MTTNVTVELADEVDPDRLAELLPDDYGLSLHRSERGLVAITLTMPQVSLVEAIRAAVRHLRGVLRTEPLFMVEAVSTEEFDRQVEAIQADVELTVPQAAALLGVSEQRVRQLVDAGRLTGRKVGRDWQVSSLSVYARLTATE